jgi:hypothetical protein
VAQRDAHVCRGYISRDATGDTWAEAATTVLNGGTYLAPPMITHPTTQPEAFWLRPVPRRREAASAANMFIVKPGHVYPEVARLVTEHGTFRIVVKANMHQAENHCLADAVADAKSGGRAVLVA